MTLFNPKPAGWASLDQITHVQMNDIGTQLPYALDGHLGGSYAPTGLIIVGGLGFELTTGLNVSAGPVAITGTLGVGGNAIFATDIAVFGTGNFVNLAVSGAANFDVDLHVAGILYADGPSLQVAGTALTLNLEVLGAADFDGTVNVDGKLTAHDEIVMTGAGRVRNRVVSAPDADHTYAATDANIIVMRNLSGAHTYTLNDASNVGSELRLVNWTPYPCPIKNSSGSTIHTLRAFIGANDPGFLHMVWHDNGGSTQWHPIASGGA